ncbi:hypothetical protein Tbd_1689 [Thiobacillus denitrificans ATCC 25259]|uniref:Lipoprotein n=1 Tax=Thiobacillus denitrificans (strain ATCC 25259 / T1) TaxID=292415 RepID=Q3SI86_THIDA|nr:hypothetical protein [Thiobacillus denitrificans]AAZ97642.1 hypothetical protein Tbd_1689 [Thiobacillus denitrificans ATCC 25259]
MKRLSLLIYAALTFPQLAFAGACSTTGQAMQQSASAGLDNALNDIYAKGDQQSKSVADAQSCLEKYSQYQIGATVNVPDLDLGKLGDALKKQAESRACQVIDNTIAGATRNTNVSLSGGYGGGVTAGQNAGVNVKPTAPTSLIDRVMGIFR